MGDSSDRTIPHSPSESTVVIQVPEKKPCPAGNPMSTNSATVSFNSDIATEFDPKRLPAWQRIAYRFRRYLAEFWGTFMIVCLGTAVVASVVLNPRGTSGNFVGICITWGIAVVAGIFISSGVSGAHLNPAVTLTLAIHKSFPWRRVPGYWISQILGGFFGAFCVYLNYIPALNAFDSGVRSVYGEPTSTATIFVTLPQQNVPNLAAFWTEFIGTFYLVLVIFACDDLNNTTIPNHGKPVIFGLIVAGVIAAFGWNTGTALNPARDLGPRLFLLCAGWGTSVFSVRSWYFWIPIIAPMTGAIVAGFVYRSLIFAPPRQK